MSWPGLRTGVLGMGDPMEALRPDQLELGRQSLIHRLARDLYREIVIRELDLRELRADDVAGGLDFSDMRRVAYEAAKTFYPPAEPGTTEKE